MDILAAAAEQAADRTAVGAALLVAALLAIAAGFVLSETGTPGGTASYLGLGTFVALIILIGEHVDAGAPAVWCLINGTIGAIGVLACTLMLRKADRRSLPTAFIAGGGGFCILATAAVCVERMLGAF